MVANVLKYRSDNLIILYYCAYYGLSEIMEVIVQNSIGFDKEYRVWFLDWSEWSVICTGKG